MEGLTVFSFALAVFVAFMIAGFIGYLWGKSQEKKKHE